jgi:hypothetical protein
MRQLSQWATRCGNALRAAAVAIDPGEEESVDEQEMHVSLDEDLRRDFIGASLTFARARRCHLLKDTPMHRRAVLLSAARIDAVLDMYLLHLEMRGDLSAATVG